jgi:hypothetical protein
MDCSVARQLLAFRRLGGPAELAPEDVAELDRHLAGCPTCAAAARRQDGFDAALGRAMKGVTVPSGLRDKLLTDALAKQGAMLRRKIYSHAAVAALVFLGVALAPGIVSRLLRPTLDPDAVAAQYDRESDDPDRATRDWLTGRGLPAEMPWDFDPRFCRLRCEAELAGRQVPMLEYLVTRPGERPDFARVFITRDSQIDTTGARDAVGSFVNVTIRKSGRFTYVILHTCPLDVFLKPQRPAA